ncbi:Nuclear transport factor 2 (NTF2) family protein with RNA binding (RRM-RBD-RNP motifs) domain [Heracleum sosnowskyi]|uniref:Nuclear transport factor 2 (NTF2) family protein with RNA binding (RRM-RBD-RNP motifs) domain n=1 Tax=Heracleum sosnowskyi TaxID=360622 RepID=A0AAD8INF8_9APIA|nr:Nuclear transport factor 2 (NTF2) family protein with RNA binding (RRM-RBD-RNP motifs) domain [Heracleum sosnowskyi]
MVGSPYTYTIFLIVNFTLQISAPSSHKFPKMTVPAANPPATVSPGAQYVGKAFVDQYYYVLGISPESLYKFYNESSLLGRPNTNGTMTSVTTLKDIDEKIQSVDCKNSKPEIETVDAQDSYKAGVIVIVTGSVIGADNVKRKFSQTFFLAPQEKGYFVLNDILRYVEEIRQLEVNFKPVDSDGDSVPSATLTSVSDNTHVSPSHACDPSNTFETEEAEVCEDLGNGQIGSPLDNEKHSVMVPEIVNEQQTDSTQNGTMAAINSDSSVVQQENRSYASILKVSKAAANPASNLRWDPAETSPNTLGSPKLSPEPAASFPASDSSPEGGNPQEDVEGHSIYIRNLPSNATVAHVIEEFSKFGPIKHGGVQLKIHRQYGYHYGFVEFESVDSMQNAIKESPIVIGRRHVVVEEKQSTFKVGSSRSTERNTSGRGEFQNSFRGRGNFEGRGYGRSEFRNTHNFSSRPTSNSGRSTEYRYQRVERV